jgi:DNA-binding GntR family transcriptional regulator
MGCGNEGKSTLRKLTMDEGPVYRTKREFAIDSLRTAIEMGRYEPGQELSQRQIGQDLDLSVTPTREAILELLANGLLERSSHQSVRVAPIDIPRLEQFYAVRHQLETQAVRLSVPNLTPRILESLSQANRGMKDAIPNGELAETQRMDMRFHKILNGQCGNEALLKTIAFVKATASFFALWHVPGRAEQSYREHVQILDGALNHDAEACVAAMRMHLDSGLDAVRGYYRDR